MNTETQNITPDDMEPNADLAAALKARDEAIAAAKLADEQRNSVVEEIKELRKKRENPTVPVIDNPVDVNQAVEEALRKRDEANTGVLREATLNKFIAEHPEFSQEQDPSGLKLNALKSKLNRFGYNSTTNIDDMNSVISDAHLILGGARSNDGIDVRQPSTAPTGGQVYQPSNASGLTREERAVAQKLGWDDKKFSEMKARHPSVINQLLNS